MGKVAFDVETYSVVGADIAQRVVQRDVPRHREVGVGAHHQCRAVVVGSLHDGSYNLSFAFGCILLEGVVVETPRQLGAPC